MLVSSIILLGVIQYIEKLEQWRKATINRASSSSRNGDEDPLVASNSDSGPSADAEMGNISKKETPSISAID